MQISQLHLQTYYGADGIDIDSVTDFTQQAAMRTMVRTYGQMPLQLFREPHPARCKSAVLTTFRIRIGSALKRIITTSPLVKVTNPFFWMNVYQHRVKLSVSSSDCDFIGTQGSPELIHAHSATVLDRIPERIVCIGNGELIITQMRVSFFQNSAPAHSSLLITWGHWDNSLVVYSTATTETTIVRLHPHPLNRVR